MLGSEASSVYRNNPSEMSHVMFRMIIVWTDEKFGVSLFICGATVITPWVNVVSWENGPAPAQFAPAHPNLKFKTFFRSESMFPREMREANLWNSPPASSTMVSEMPHPFDSPYWKLVIHAALIEELMLPTEIASDSFSPTTHTRTHGSSTAVFRHFLIFPETL